MSDDGVDPAAWTPLMGDAITDTNMEKLRIVPLFWNRVNRIILNGSFCEGDAAALIATATGIRMPFPPPPGRSFTGFEHSGQTPRALLFKGA
jgi:hypothetical protein